LKTSHNQIPAYVTRDGSEIRELIHPSAHGGRNQSLAEATALPGARTLLHRHRLTEEIYHITAGSGRMTLGNETFDVAVGDSVLIPPGISSFCSALAHITPAIPLGSTVSSFMVACHHRLVFCFSDGWHPRRGY
jgi:quercetin dioxygenase-like cupin family protein